MSRLLCQKKLSLPQPQSKPLLCRGLKVISKHAYLHCPMLAAMANTLGNASILLV